MLSNGGGGVIHRFGLWFVVSEILKLVTREQKSGFEADGAGGKVLAGGRPLSSSGRPSGGTGRELTGADLT